MKHDEKKIEEIKSRYPESVNIEGLEPAFSSDLMEYAEHIVQQRDSNTPENVKDFCNQIGFQLNPSNDTMKAIRLFRANLPEFMRSMVQEERKRISEKIKKQSESYLVEIIDPTTNTFRAQCHGYEEALKDITKAINQEDHD